MQQNSKNRRLSTAASICGNERHRNPVSFVKCTIGDALASVTFLFTFGKSDKFLEWPNFYLEAIVFLKAIVFLT